MHCHGVGPYDFTDIPSIDLHAIESILAKRNHGAVLTLYLPKQNFTAFLELMNVFASGREQGAFEHIVGIGLEGPLLASHGGTPETGVWAPTKNHWQQLANCGSKGLTYVIFSPDIDLPTSNFYGDDECPSITWITNTLLAGGVLPAPGHFVKSDPVASSERLQHIFDLVAKWGKSPTITDHLYNDMPHNFKHAWRTVEEKKQRDSDISKLQLDKWNADNLDHYLGPVPATMIRNAKKGIVKICQNFDGEHVDLAIVQKTVELVGSDNLLMMTDSIESKLLAGRDLHHENESTLLYQQDGIVAAGSQSVEQLIRNMQRIDLSNIDVLKITSENPREIFYARVHSLEFVKEELKIATI